MLHLQLVDVDIDYDLIVPAPISSKHRRKRGYNQAWLIAKELSGLCGVPCSDVLIRHGQTRQVGADRQTRLKQLKGEIAARKPSAVKGRKVLIVDDVITTGATVSECARALRKAGVKSVNATVVAKH
jgi:ComF family protein